MKEKFQAEKVFRGPRLKDGRVRMIFQVRADDNIEDFFNKLEQLGMTRTDQKK